MRRPLPERLAEAEKGVGKGIMPITFDNNQIPRRKELIKMGTLYELNQKYKELLELALDEEVDPQAIADTMEAIEGEIEEKLDGYAYVLKELGKEEEILDAQLKYLEAEKDRLRSRKNAISGHKDDMKDKMKNMLDVMPERKVRTNFFTFFVRKNQPSVSLRTDSTDGVPDKYLKKDFNKTAIKEALKAGEKLDFADLVQTESVIIR